MRVTRRRKRTRDPLASPEWIRSIFNDLRASFPSLSSYKDRDLVKLFRAVRHIERYQATDTRRGRPSRWSRQDLIRIGSKLADILKHQTAGRLSVATFVDHYLRILDFPSDVIERLAEGTVNLFEAEQLARLTAQRINCSQTQAKRKRKEVLKSHLKSLSSGERLRRRINEIIGSSDVGKTSSTGSFSEPETRIDLEDFDPYDASHLFWEEIKRLGFAFRDIKPEDVTDELVDELLTASQPLWAVLAKIQRRKEGAYTKKQTQVLI